ncbi:hypothetical protein [Fodinicurvata fenggangensis]|uniref:hypothetical protein n=1 Tax=Fodinicurvata fenggangensis TaxID=1121830 RepID=UPI0012DE5FC7|nr:hypothetical protein [Fodinicurvata fenggangensis]
MISRHGLLRGNIHLDEGTFSIDLLEEALGYFGLGLSPASKIIQKLVTVTATWRDVAKEVGARTEEITRMAGAFGHHDLKRARTL